MNFFSLRDRTPCRAPRPLVDTGSTCSVDTVRDSPERTTLHMRRKLLALVAVSLMATASITACDDSDGSSDGGGGTTTGSGKARVGIILPDTKSSQRWGTDD